MPHQNYESTVGIYVPSRFADGQPIPPDLLENEIRRTRGELARIFSGATQSSIQARKQHLVGTYIHAADSTLRAVDENIVSVSSFVSAAALENEDLKQQVLSEALRLRDTLLQECILIEWGAGAILTESITPPRGKSSFRSLSPPTRQSLSVMEWSRVQEPRHLCGLLSLNGWHYPKPAASTAPPSAPPGLPLSAIAWSDDNPERVAWQWLEPRQPIDSELKRLPKDHILIHMSSAERAFRVWMKSGTRICGPRTVSLCPGYLAQQFCLSLLDAGDISLADFLDAEGATSRFYSEIRRCIENVQAQLPKNLSPTDNVAQRLVGRLMFIRFVEEKGWMEPGALKQLFDAPHQNFYADSLLPLFACLNTPIPLRQPLPASPLARIPYLNGGLFEPHESELNIRIPNDLFSPAKRGSILEVLYRYQFTLDEAAARQENVSVDPAMFGRVLESLTSHQDRKKQGVHYTPAPVARTLASRAIIQQIVRAGKPNETTLISHAVLENLLAGRAHDLSEDGAVALKNRLEGLRIIDPAIGSGALLVACLEVMLDLYGKASEVLGNSLKKGKKAWADQAREFIHQCLYGVDISSSAIDVAQLRLWLFLAIGEESPRPLPDLRHNLRVGDSLRFDEAEEKLLRCVSSRSYRERRLGFDEVEQALDQTLDALRAYRAAPVDSPATRQARQQKLDQAKERLRLALGGAPIEPGSVAPFAWVQGFPEVFRRPNRGFDIVIANPPYVRIATLDPKHAAALKQRYRSMRDKNSDLYFAFLERCLQPGDAPDRSPLPEQQYGLAGKNGSIAVIMPSFAQSTSAETLRSLLANGSHIDLWVDFVDHQVFPSATNYVALLFADARKGKAKTFPAQIVTPEAFAAMQADHPWLESLPVHPVPYTRGGWNVRAASDPPPPGPFLAELFTVTAGIQTSLDAVYLFELVSDPGAGSLLTVRSEKATVELERDALFPCAKGSVHLQGDQLKGMAFALWPYDSEGNLLPAAALAERYPRAWVYLNEHRAELENREKGRFRDARWYRFRRPQGIREARQPKIMIPSMMKQPAAYWDRDGRLACTASGKGGGGGWILLPSPAATPHLAKISRYLASDAHQEWLCKTAQPQKGGWWGVDRKTLERCPLPPSVLAAKPD